MNRVFENTTPGETPTSRRQISQGLRDEAEALLRDVAHVLHLARRLKAELAEERDVRDLVTA